MEVIKDKIDFCIDERVTVDGKANINYKKPIPIKDLVAKYEEFVKAETTALKQVIIVNTQLGMRRGKVASQAAHAAVLSAYRAPYGLYKEWTAQGHAKIVLAGNLAMR
jgi:hypothetical protein